jgi:hypothetical protein
LADDFASLVESGKGLEDIRPFADRQRWNMISANSDLPIRAALADDAKPLVTIYDWYTEH